MQCSPQRRLSGGGLIAAILAGCSGGPFDIDTEPHRLGGELHGAATLPPAARARMDVTPPGIRGEAPLPVLDERAGLEEYLRYAALNNPGLEAEFQAWRAAVARTPQVGAMPDPRFSYGYYIGEVETRVGPMQHALGLAQTFPWFGKLQDREDAAARAANAAWQRFEAARLDLFLRVERAYNELYFLRRSIDITRDGIELLQQFERVARARYRLSTAGHPDVIRVQVELGKMEDRRHRLADLRAPYTARLNAALNRAPDAALPWPSSVADRVDDLDAAALLRVLRDRNPELIALREEVARERVNAEIARKDGLPDFTIALAYTVIDERDGVDVGGNGDDALLASVSVNLPLWREKYDAGVREAVARRLSVASRREDRTNRLGAELEEALFEHRDAHRRVELYRDTLIPKATESIQASLAGFEQGTTDLLDLIDTERTRLEFQLGLERALVDRATSYARIECLIGRPLSADGSRPAPPETTP